jgi:drug/metabolite transporter (DMT)-like permease
LADTSRRSLALGILCMAGSVGALAAMQMFVKLAGPEYSPFQAVFFRNAIAAMMVVPLMFYAAGPTSFRTTRPVGHFVRALFGVAGNASFYYAYSTIPMSDGMSIAMSVPIFTTLLAIPFLGEKVGLRRWIAIAIGFAGVMIALDPTGDFQVGALYALFGTLCWAASLILIKQLSATETPYLIVFYYMITGVAVSLLILPFVWITPTTEHLIFYICAGLVGGLGQILMTFAMKFAPAAVVTPFEYTAICWAVLFDLLIWNVLPDLTTVLGAGIVIATGLYIWHRETRVRPAT